MFTVWLFNVYFNSAFPCWFLFISFDCYELLVADIELLVADILPKAYNAFLNVEKQRILIEKNVFM